VILSNEDFKAYIPQEEKAALPPSPPVSAHVGLEVQHSEI
jgi:hypothetical protein